jgi:hypothetical protein
MKRTPLQEAAARCRSKNPILEKDGPLSPEELKQLHCANCNDEDPNCTGLFFVGLCHPRAHLEVAVLEGDKIAMRCADCQQPVFSVQSSASFDVSAVSFCEHHEHDTRVRVVEQDCHPAPLKACYSKRQHSIEIFCAECDGRVGYVPMPEVN